MKNVRLPAQLVERAENHKRTAVLDVGLCHVDGTPSGYFHRHPTRFLSTTKVLAAAVRLGLDEMDKRKAAADAKQGKVFQLPTE
jgi:hypothetical protein